MVVRMLVTCTETDVQGHERALTQGDDVTMPDGIALELADLGLAACSGDDSSPPYSQKKLTKADWKLKDEDHGTQPLDGADA